eukprot:tig00020704_g13147.t1
MVPSASDAKEISPPTSILEAPAPKDAPAEALKPPDIEAVGAAQEGKRRLRRSASRCADTGRKVSLSTILVGLLVVQVVGAALVTWGVTWYFSNRNLEALARRVVEEVRRGVRDTVAQHLASARSCADRTRQDVESGRTTLEQWRRTYESLHQTLVGCPQLQRLAVGFGSTPKTRQVFAAYRCYGGEENCPTHWHAIQNNVSYVYTYAADEKRGQPERFLFGAPYLVESGPGAPVANASAASWSDVFIMAQLSPTGQAVKALVEEDLYKRLVMTLVQGIGPTRDVNLLPLPAPAPGLPAPPALPAENATYPSSAGFVRATVSLSALSEMLRSGLGRPYPSSIAFVTNSAGYMVASSIETLVAAGEPGSDAWKRMRADSNPSEVVRDVYAALGACEDGSAAFVRAGGRQQVASCSPLEVPPNLSWKVFIAVPTDDAFGEIKSSAVSISCANAAWLLFCIVVSVAAGMLVTRPLAKLRASILQLTRSIEGVSKEIKRSGNRPSVQAHRGSREPPPAPGGGAPSDAAAGPVPVRKPTAMERIRGWLRPALGRGSPEQGAEREARGSAAGSGNESDATEAPSGGSSSRSRSMVLKTGIAELATFSTLMRSLQSRFVQFQRLSATELELLKTLLAERKTKMEMEVRHEETRKFLATMSHEMRTPLNGVLGMLYLARDCSLGEEAARCVEDALISVRPPFLSLSLSLSLFGAGDSFFRSPSPLGEHLLALVNDVLDIQKVEAGLMELQVAPTSVVETVQSAVRIVQPRAEAKGLRLEVLIDPSVPSVIVSDADRLRQVLLNLVTNAVKYSHAGTVTVRPAALRFASLRFWTPGLLDPRGFGEYL